MPPDFDQVRRRRRAYERALGAYRQAVVAELDRGTSYVSSHARWASRGSRYASWLSAAAPQSA